MLKKNHQHKAAAHIGSNEGAPIRKSFSEPRQGENWRLRENKATALHFDRFLTSDEVEQYIVQPKATVKMLANTAEFDAADGLHVTAYARFRNTTDFYLLLTDVQGSRGSSARVLLDRLVLKDGKVVPVWGALRAGQWIANFGVPAVSPMVFHPAVFQALFEEVTPAAPVVPEPKLGDVFDRALAARKATQQ